MTYQTGSATDLEDLLANLDTFATGTPSGSILGGWTSIYTTNNPQTTDGWFELNRNDLSVSMKYPIFATVAELPVHMSVHHATGSTSSSAAPGAHTADSGNGYTGGTTGHNNANLATERYVSDIGNGPFGTYHFFGDDTATHDYIHVVVQAASGMYRHLLFGKFVKFGDNWVGSEYVCGHRQHTGGTTSAVHGNHNLLLDGLATSNQHSGTVRIASGLIDQGAAVWGVSCAVSHTTIGTDTAGNIRQQIHGGFRTGMEARGFGAIIGNSSAGFVAMYPIVQYYHVPDEFQVQRLGRIPAVRALNIRNFDAEQVITIGGDDWVIFPMSIKTTAAVEFRSLNSGLAFKRVS